MRKRKTKDVYGIVKLGEPLFGGKEKSTYKQTLITETRQQTFSNLNKIELKFAKCFFRILIIHDKEQECAALVRLIRDDLQFTQVKVTTTMDDAWEALSVDKPYDVVLSIYRTTSGAVDGFDLFRNLKELKKIPEFFIVDSYTEEEYANLAKAGVLILPQPISKGQIELFINGFYVRKMQKIMESIK